MKQARIEDPQIL